MKNSLRHATEAVKFPSANAELCASAYGNLPHAVTTIAIMLSVNANENSYAIFSSV